MIEKVLFCSTVFDDGLTLKTLKLAFIRVCIQTLQLYPTQDVIR